MGHGECAPFSPSSGKPVKYWGTLSFRVPLFLCRKHCIVVALPVGKVSRFPNELLFSCRRLSCLLKYYLLVDGAEASSEKGPPGNIVLCVYHIVLTVLLLAKVPPCAWVTPRLDPTLCSVLPYCSIVANYHTKGNRQQQERTNGEHYIVLSVILQTQPVACPTLSSSERLRSLFPCEEN